MLSPADLNGVRARQFLSPSARARAAVTFRSGDGVPIADAFTFISGLYFRGKFAYARRFAAPPASWEDEGIYVIAPGFGLVPPSWPLDKIRLRRLRRTPVDLRSRAYRRPLQEQAARLAEKFQENTSVILLGSIATGKYVELLRPIFGNRLLVPRAFWGLGDMSRGALMLRAVRSGEELEYLPFTTLRPDRG